MNPEDEWGEYFNPMDFHLNFRCLWLPNNPSVRIEPGGKIYGPHKYLSNYRFLMPVPMKMYKVSSITVDQDGSYTDVDENDDEVIVINENDVVEEIKDENNENKISEDDITKLPFDINEKEINWLQYKTDDFVEFANILHIDISHIKPGRQKRWEILKLIKKAIGKDVK